jgi:hypothetical protein
MINKYTFNKRKKNSIILLHGLYTTSGFWLPYLNLFKDFRIIIYDINYSVLLEAQDTNYYLQENLNEYREGENIVATISHSFGTVISDLAFENNQHTIFKICPVAFSKRLDPQSFIIDIENKTSLTKENIYEYMSLVSDFTLKFKKQLNFNGSIYIPDQDGFFSYEVPENKRTEFKGDHFNICSALRNIVVQLTTNP